MSVLHSHPHFSDSVYDSTEYVLMQARVVFKWLKLLV